MKTHAETASISKEILGYLNFSGGRPDAAFQRRLSDLSERCQFDWKAIEAALVGDLAQLQRELPAFADVTQASSAMELTFQRLYPAYREHHRDLLAHVSDEELQQPFFLARLFEAVVEQGGPWNEVDRIVRGALNRLNDYLGFRPIAVLENGRRCEPYDHERFRPLPIYLRTAGTAAGPFRKLLDVALEQLSQVPEPMLVEAYLNRELIDEISIDLRAHDHTHPVNRRTNYLFGEWDPHQIDLKGRYRRFVLRRIILDALLNWMRQQKRSAADEVLFDAGAVLVGTMIMASAISGAGPDSHDSTVSLTTLLPKVARQRDEYYSWLLARQSGPRRKRLDRSARATQQPFGHVRQHLNLFLANYGTQQVQRRHLAHLLARLGYSDAAQAQAAVIPSVSVRFETELQWRLAACQRSLRDGQLESADRLLQEFESLLDRGIHCGALVDPWNILGFQAQFPLFNAREDSVPDHRAETLLHLVDGHLEGYSRTLQEAVSRGQTKFAAVLRERFSRFAENWDKYATTTVAELSRVSGQETLESALKVAQSLQDWRAAGEASGQISFWRDRVAEFESCKAYAQVVTALLDRSDHVASMGLLMQWLSEADRVGLQAGPHSIFPLLVRWLDSLAEAPALTNQDRWKLVRRLFESLEANAGDHWDPPRLRDAFGSSPAKSSNPLDEISDGASGNRLQDDDDSSDDDDGVFGAAYDDVVFRDSADDGHEGQTLDGQRRAPGDGDFERLSRELEPRLQFVRTLLQLWQLAASRWSSFQPAEATEESNAQSVAAVRAWLDQTQRIELGLLGLIGDLTEQELDLTSGEHDANVEYDFELQSKMYLLQSALSAAVTCHTVNWSLCGLLDDNVAADCVDRADRAIVAVFRATWRRDGAAVRKALPSLLRSLRRRPLLYVPIEHDGAADDVLQARSVQAAIRFLLAHLPRLGLYRETWHVLKTANEMERLQRPAGMAVTEFDRLFRVALRSTLAGIVDASPAWNRGRFTDEDLVEIVGQVVEFYLEQWLEHSATMRLSSVESLRQREVWDEVVEFIRKYGADVLNAQTLTLGNIRAILHQGIDFYLQRLEELEDPLHPIGLLADLRDGAIDYDETADTLEFIYQIVVDKFDRFLEYNTTTTQSDYGNVFYTLLDFLRLEVGYDRDNWNFLPVTIAHEVLVKAGRMEAAQIWEEVFVSKSESVADKHLADMAKLEKKYGMRMPSVANHLQERFVRPLALVEMIALLPQVRLDARAGKFDSPAFTAFSNKAEAYARQTSGSGLEVPAWLRSIEEELNQLEQRRESLAHDADLDFKIPAPEVSLAELKRQIKSWKEPLSGRKGTA